MLIDRIESTLAHAASYRAIVESLAAGDDASLAIPGLIRPVLVSALALRLGRPMLVVVAGEEAAERFARQTAAYLSREYVLHYEDRRDLPWGSDAPDPAVVSARARALYALDKARPMAWSTRRARRRTTAERQNWWHQPRREAISRKPS